MYRAFDFRFNSKVLTFTLSVTFLTGLVFGLAPALQASRPDPIADLKDRDSAGLPQSAPRGCGTRW